MTDQPIKRRKKSVIIRRDQLPASKLATTKKPPPKPKKKLRAKPPTPKVKKTSPSDARAQLLDASLNGLPTWLNAEPLALGIKKQIFQHIARHNLSSSQRVVKKLLHRHTHTRRYLQAVQTGESRYNLDGTGVGIIMQAEKEHAAQMLAK